MKFTYGFEIEIEGFPNWKSELYDELNRLGYLITTDGSLRNWGKEIISGVLTNIPSVKFRFKQVLNLLEKHGCMPSDRTGIHLHVGTFKNPRSVYEYLKVYLMYERQIFDLYPERLYNNFCVPVLDSDVEIIRWISEIEKNKNSKAHQIFIDNWGKYSAINLGSYNDHGTIEYRVPVTEFNTERLFEFLAIVRSINNIYNGKPPTIEPKDENVIEAKEFFESSKRFNLFNAPSKEEVIKLFNLNNNSEDAEITSLIEDVIREMEV